MAKKKEIVYSKKEYDKVRLFAKEFMKGLDKDAWGTIDPYIFNEIYEDKFEDLDDNAKSMLKIIHSTLEKMKI